MQLTFATPEEAGHALHMAARANDESALAQILGPEAKAILSSGDSEEDRAALASFVTKYDRMNPVTYGDSGIMTFILGPDGVVYQKDLGPTTTDSAASIREYNPTDGFTPAE